MLEYGSLIFGFLGMGIGVRNIGFCNLVVLEFLFGILSWDLVVWCLGFGMLEFGSLIFGFCSWELEFGI